MTGSLGSPTTTTTTVATTCTTAVPTTTTAGTSTSATSTSTTVAPTTSTTLPAAPCVNGAPVSRAVVRMTHLGSPLGDQGMLVSGVLGLPADVPAGFDPAGRGAQLLVEDLGSGQDALADMTAGSAPIPPGPPGAGCGERDGWVGGVYRNRSNALDPPACSGGSAHGLQRLRLRDKRRTGGGIAFKAVMTDTPLASPVGPVRVTLVLGAEAAVGLAGECGTIAFPVAACGTKRRTYTCR